MDLLSFRIIGHPLLPHSSWLEVGDGLNVLRTHDGDQAQALLRMLQTINPPYDLQQIDPFGGLPRYATSQPYTRRIIPAKKTAALAIFSASPQLVEELAALDPILYETDRIEFGRRRDYSQWINFIELAGSSRWSEIAPIVRSLLPLAGPEAAPAIARLEETLATWCGTDRIKGQGAMELEAQLCTLQAHLPGEHRALLDRCFQAIDRARHFIQAKAMVAARLPLFLAIACPAVEPPGRERAASAAPFAFFAARLQAGDEASPESRLQQVNHRLQIFDPDLPLQFRLQGVSLFLESTRTTAPCLYTELAPMEKIRALMAGLTVLHETLYGCPPILLLDLTGLHLGAEEQADLLKWLRQYGTERQCLVAADREMLACCIEASEEAANKNHPWLRLVEV